MSTTESLRLAEQESIVSRSKVFEVGFFEVKSESHSDWYLGLWYKEDLERSCLWVANREKPLRGSNGTLSFLDNNLFLIDGNNSAVWWTNLTGGGVRSPLLAELLDNGNFVVKDSNNPNVYLWQSFDFPTDTLLPQAQMKPDKVLNSWRAPYDPSIGDYTFEIHSVELGSSFAIFIDQLQRTDAWNGYQFGDMPPVFQYNDDDSFSIKTPHTRLTVGSITGFYNLYTWIPESNKWNMSWSTYIDVCYTEACGTFSYCSKNTSTPCHCIEGFNKKLENSWTGCVRRTSLNCGGDVFTELKNMKLPSYEISITSPNMKLPPNEVSITSPNIGVQECKEKCLRNCACLAFAIVENRKNHRLCVVWTGELNDMRNYTSGGHSLYVRVAAKDIEDHTKKYGKSKGLPDSWIIGVIVGSVIVGLSFASFYYWKKHQRRTQGTELGPTQTDIVMNEIAGPDRFQLMEFRVVAEATDHFSNANKLGQGGFGTVYKGTLPDGKEIAVKRLNARSSQGFTEFRNEVRLILRVLHVNLVRLEGCCCEGEEKILVYEYLNNSSLDRYIFDKTKSRLLNWQQRFKIAKGIAEGLSYLHNFTTPPILHRDLKPSNVLLTQDMTPKISDFGLAQMLEHGTTEAATDRVAGTYGYMSQEYALDHMMSEKSDVFSYGVMLLEIITGICNLSYCKRQPGDSLLDYVWNHWNEGKGLEVIDLEFLDASFVGDEVLRSIQVGLLCVEEHVGDRPNTRSIVLMLENTQTNIPKPKKPDFYYAKVLRGELVLSSPPIIAAPSYTTNFATMSDVEGR